MKTILIRENKSNIDSRLFNDRCNKYNKHSIIFCNFNKSCKLFTEIQSMTNTDTKDLKATVKQIKELEN